MGWLSLTRFWSCVGQDTDPSCLPIPYPSHHGCGMHFDLSTRTCYRKFTIARALILPAHRAAAWSCVLERLGNSGGEGKTEKKRIEARISWKKTLFNAKLLHAGWAKKTQESCDCFPLHGRSLPRLLHGAVRKNGFALTVRAWQETPALILNLPASDKQLAAAGGSADTEMETR